MSFSSICHLSGLVIKEDEPVVCLPVSYSTVKHTTSLVYSQNRECCAIGLPLIGEYNGYGSVHNLDENSFSYLLFQDLISTFSVDKNKKPQNIQKYKFFSIEDKYNRPSHGEFLSDADIKKHYDNSEFFTLDNINVENFLDLCHSRAIFNISSHNVFRIGFLLIKKSIFDKMTDSHFSKLFPNHKKNILSFCKEKSENISLNVDFSALNDEEFDIAYQKKEISEDFLHNDILLLFNGSNSITNITKCFLNKHWKNKKFDNKKIAKYLLYSAQFNYLYSSLGKSLYPNTNRRTDCSAIVSLCDVIKEEISNIQENNVENLIKNGYSQEEDIQIFEDSKFQDW